MSISKIRKYTIAVDNETHKKIKIIAAKKRITMSELVNQIFKELD